MKEQSISEFSISGMSSSACFYKKALSESNVEGTYAATYYNQWSGKTIIFGAKSDIDAVVFAQSVGIDKDIELNLIFRLSIEVNKIAEPELIYDSKR